MENGLYPWIWVRDGRMNYYKPRVAMQDFNKRLSQHVSWFHWVTLPLSLSGLWLELWGLWLFVCWFLSFFLSFTLLHHLLSLSPSLFLCAPRHVSFSWDFGFCGALPSRTWPPEIATFWHPFYRPAAHPVIIHQCHDRPAKWEEIGIWGVPSDQVLGMLKQMKEDCRGRYQIWHLLCGALSWRNQSHCGTGLRLGILLHLQLFPGQVAPSDSDVSFSDGGGGENC